MPAQFALEVAVDVPLPGPFTYLSDDPLPSGQRVRVPFGRRSICGIVLDCSLAEKDYPFSIKPIDRVLGETPPLPESLLSMARFAADYYLYPYGQTLFCALPVALRSSDPVKLPARQLWRLTASGRVARVPAGHKARHAIWRSLHETAQSLAALRQTHADAQKILLAWLQQGWVEQIEPEPALLRVEQEVALTTEQQQALARMTAETEQTRPWVLQGVTGSGKTEVYLQLIAQQLIRGRQVLVLVPEINLTPQLIARFTQRFPATPLSLLHSNLSDRERLDAWSDAWLGHSRIVIGTRLAVFTPLPELGLVIVDEEHDTSFKQQDSLRYNARDLAVWRAHRAAVPVVLGSATPSLETLHNVALGRYCRVLLQTRAHSRACLPKVCLQDVRRMKLTDGLSDDVLTHLRRRLQAGEMSLVYINRRGFSPVLACTDCGWISGCPRCSAKLVVHLFERKLRCHHCAWEEPVPQACPECGNPDIKPLGEGTQRVEAMLAQALPTARIMRIDRDSTQHKAAWDKIYHQVQAHEVDILVGTQMLAKGHDFGALSLVVILNADAALYSADFRASERLFAQLMQVSGRAGRADIPGEVIVQTQWPDHPLYQALVRQDYDAYAQILLAERQSCGFPPASYQAILRAESATLAEAMAFLNLIRARLEDDPAAVQVYGPAPALMMRLAARERAQIIFESGQRSSLHRMLLSALALLSAPGTKRSVRWSLDVDPQET